MGDTWTQTLTPNSPEGSWLVGWLAVRHGYDGRWPPPQGVLPTDLCRVNGYGWRSPPWSSLLLPLPAHSLPTLFRRPPTTYPSYPLPLSLCPVPSPVPAPSLLVTPSHLHWT